MTGAIEAKEPNVRRLRGYAFDPSLTLNLRTHEFNDIVFNVPWEALHPGPVGEYIEVIDYDPTQQTFYDPVDLNNLYIVAQDGLEPSESNPQFHQQMVYAVAMITIQNFEKALGRKVIWSSHFDANTRHVEYVQRIRIYPHAMREANAYYSPEKKAILFGYFFSEAADNPFYSGGIPVFTCLSHDIIAHEVTHAILDGMHRNYNNPTNPDVLAFHEAFADIVALFQHFSFPVAVEDQIIKTGGDLSLENMLGQIAQEFGSAIGKYGALRDALGSFDTSTHTWRSSTPDPNQYSTSTEPHDRGSILVAAVFDAFLSIYNSRIEDLMRIASITGSSNRMDRDVAKRLAEEASRTASSVLTTCIQALDYCPPVDITFGDFLRAIITADIDACGNSNHDYRLAFIVAFRKRGIFPAGVKLLNEDSLRLPGIPAFQMMSRESTEDLSIVATFLREFVTQMHFMSTGQEIFRVKQEFQSGRGRQSLQEMLAYFKGEFLLSRLTGLAFGKESTNLGIAKNNINNSFAFQIARLELINRSASQTGQIVHYGRGKYDRQQDRYSYNVNQVSISLIQKSRLHIHSGKVVAMPEKGSSVEGDFEFVGGCTLIFDIATLTLRYIISKPLTTCAGQEIQLDERRLASQLAFYRENNDAEHIGEMALYFGADKELFGMLHRH